MVTHSKRFGISSTPHLIRRYAQDTNSVLERVLWGRESIIARSFQSVKRDGLLKTFFRGTRLIKENDPTGVLDTYSNPRYKIKVGNLVSDKIKLKYPLINILESQLQSDNFQRYDIILCLLAIEHQVPVKQFNMINDSELRSSLKIIQKYNEGWSPPKMSVGINTSREILDPELVAIAINQSADPIPVELREERVMNSYDLDWLREIGLSEETILMSQARCEELLDEVGLLYKFFVWPPGRQFDQNIQDVINSYGTIVQDQELILDENKFKNFVMDIYDIEHEFTDRHQHKSKLKGKIDYSLKYGSNVRIYRVLLSEPRLKEGSSNTMAYAKERIRKNCYTDLPLGKAHLNPTVHGTDNHKHNRLVNRVISEYESE